MHTITTLLILLASHEKNHGTREWTDLIRGGMVPYHRLVFEDFRPADPHHDSSLAYTTGFIRYRIEPKVEGSGPFQATVGSLRVWSGLDRNQSWRRPWLTATHGFLNHEQHHLDINELAANRFANTPTSNLPAGHGKTREEAARDLSRNVDRYFQSILRDSHQEHARYDRETSGGLDTKAQIAWSNRIMNSLRAAGIKAVWAPRS